jgi:outer membrane protein OmpA-like peptidoglycan-associated protein
MRHNFRRPREQDEEESVFVSMTDMTVSFLFIVILLLAYFASHFSGAGETVPRPVYQTVVDENIELKKKLENRESTITALQKDISIFRTKILALELKISQLNRRDPLEEYLSKAASVRVGILSTLREKLKIDFPDLMIEISAESDALRFQGEGLFAKGETQLSVEKRKVVDAIAGRLHELLPSYTFGDNRQWNGRVNPSAAIIEAVQIEGHTDSDGDDVMNLHLSTGRANATFIAMLQAAPSLTSHKNLKQQPVLSVAGYGKWRPVASNDTPQGKATNRRIDLRIIMHTPRNLEEVERIKGQLKGESKQEK